MQRSGNGKEGRDMNKLLRFTLCNANKKQKYSKLHHHVLLLEVKKKS